MDFSESTNVVYNRIQKIEPENVSKIIGFLLLQDHGEREMIRLAFSPDNLIHSLINKAKTELGLSKPPVLAPISPSQVNPVPSSELHLPFTSYLPVLSPSVSSPRTLRGAKTYWDPQVAADQQPVHNADYVPPIFSDSVAQDYHLQNHMQFMTLDDQLESANSVASDYSSNSYDPEPTFGVRVGRRSPSFPEFPVKVCHYFSKGFCKHGNNCRYFHGNPMAESSSLILSPSLIELPNEDHVFSPGCLEKLEMELTELLKSRRGFPVSIASLPMIYYEKFGRTLQAEGYLTESQRHGKAGYSLTKLIARLRNNIRLIDRPHGQHSVILAENAPTYLEYAGERSDSGGIVAGSRQIYLTFPAESTFTEQDVSNYFKKFGLVEDVRIPCQQKRMFGFITFVYSETVKQILAKGNPHFVCGARVLVKPYRERSRLLERKLYADKSPHAMHNSPHFMDKDSELNSMVVRVGDNLRFRKQLSAEHGQALKLESRHSLELRLAPKTFSRHPHIGHSMDELKCSEAHAEEAESPTSAKRFNYLLDVLNNDKMRHINTNYRDQDSSQGPNLPESPFASAIGSNSISTIT